MERIRCPGCMKEKQQRPVCEHCGYNENVPNYSHQLPVGTILQGRYTVGKALGQGGFGITYIGWDGSLQAPIAIKEYYPNSFVSRECAFSLGVHCAGEGAEEQFRLNRERFLREARILAKLSSVPGIVRVQNLFEENNTAYIVMEYVEGIDLKHYIRMRNRVLTWEETLSVMRPILYALHKVHEAELVHRDISPDNIMILPDGTAKLLDFGAAREVADAEVDKELPQSTEAILKHGFAPMEQYRRRGSLGPWTDVYALCATMYYCMTGKVPNSAPERIMGDDNVNWRQIPGLTEQQIQTLEKGLALLPENRIRTMRELSDNLFRQIKNSTTVNLREKKTIKDNSEIHVPDNLKVGNNLRGDATAINKTKGKSTFGHVVEKKLKDIFAYSKNWYYLNLYPKINVNYKYVLLVVPLLISFICLYTFVLREHDGWIMKGGNTYYYQDGQRVTGWQIIDGKKYYFFDNGNMATGRQAIDGLIYYFSEDGTLKVIQTLGSEYQGATDKLTGWQTIDGKKYYYTDDGIMVTGWEFIGGRKYYFFDDGHMAIGKQIIEGKAYVFSANGALTSTQSDDSESKSDEKSETGWKTIDGKKYYYTKDGVMVTGWQFIGGRKYYFTKNGVMVTGKNIINGKIYHFSANGALLRDF